MLRFVTILLLFPVLVAAAVPDLIIFDEDDPLGRDYYDASIGQVQSPSTLRLLAPSKDKMPVQTNHAASGHFSGVIEWNSRPGGHWAMHIFRPGFPIINLQRYETISLALNSPKPIPPDSLPVLALRDIKGRTISRSLEEALPGGIDTDPSTWQRITVPLRDFRSKVRSERAVNLERVRHITLSQGRPDSEMRALWIDDLRLTSSERTVSTAPSPAPPNIIGRAGDRSVTLHWDAVSDANLRGYHIYRATHPDGPFSEIAGAPVQIQSIADTQVENGETYFYQVKAANDLGPGKGSYSVELTPRPFADENDFLDYVQATAFDYFWYEAHPRTGLVRDRSQPWSAASIAATGFGLTAMGIGIDHGWITREQGAKRVRTILETLSTVRQGQDETDTSGYRGWFYHFLDVTDGTRFGTSELSSIDTALLLGGVLYASEYFTNHTQLDERRIEILADQIFARVNWHWMLNGGDTLSMGWHPESGFIRARWTGYNEASILYLLALGADASPRAKPELPPEHWRNWTRTYDWKTSYGYSFIHFPPLFGHQYSALWVDFRGIADDYTRAQGITYFENSRRATLAQREYCIANPGKFAGYGPNVWGLTACDGPGSNNTHSYIARGAPPPENDDGTVAPTAAGGSIPFAPAECIRALRHMYDTYREKIWCGYGFRDAFNLGEDWWGEDVIGIDQGPILIMIENYRTGKVWEVMHRSAVLQRGLKQAGFRPVTETPAGLKNP